MADSSSDGMAKRQVAFKVSIADILNNPYKKEEGWLPNYVLVGSKKVSRANIIGVIVSKESGDGDSENFVIDDGSDRVSLRFFKPDDLINVGDVVNVIGRPREFGSDRYLVPEIMKRIKDTGWVQVRKKELMLDKHEINRDKINLNKNVQESPVDKETVSGSDVESTKLETVSSIVESEDFTESPQGLILDTIKKLDDGSGVSFEDASVKSGVDSAEKWIKRLLETGDIFEVKPGRYKVLE